MPKKEPDIISDSFSPELWVERYGDDLFRYACFRTREESVAEDLVQETLLAALKGKDSYQGRASEKTWLIGILKHKIIDHFRKQSRNRPQLVVETTDQSIDDLFNAKGRWRREVRRWNADPTELLEQKDFWRVFYDCLKKLPGNYADAITLRMLEELETNEICKVLNVTSTNLWVLLHRARMNLRGCLDKNWFTRIDNKDAS